MRGGAGGFGEPKSAYDPNTVGGAAESRSGAKDDWSQLMGRCRMGGWTAGFLGGFHRDHQPIGELICASHSARDVVGA
jgi:hypothetical protein